MDAMTIKYHSELEAVADCTSGCVAIERVRRAEGSQCSDKLNTCRMLLVADEEFYQHIGNNDIANTVHILVCLHISLDFALSVGESVMQS